MIHQDARVYAGLFDRTEAAVVDVNTRRRIYVHVARGAVEANQTKLEAGDGLKLTDSSVLHLQRGREAEVLVFDLPED